MNAKHLLLSCALAACSASAFAQWQWVDESGRNVFSDRPPPSHVPAAKIVKRPPGALPPALPQQLVITAIDAPEATAPTPEPAPDAAATAEAKKAEEEATKAAQAAEEAKRQADEAKRQAEEAERKKQAAAQAKTRQDNCARARTAQNSLQSGMRVATINEKGERGFMTDAQRQSELSKASAMVKDNC